MLAFSAEMQDKWSEQVKEVQRDMLIKFPEDLQTGNFNSINLNH